MVIIFPSGYGLYRICTKSQGWLGPIRANNMRWLYATEINGTRDVVILRQTNPWTKHAKACGDFSKTYFDLMLDERVIWTCDYSDMLCYISRDENAG